MAIEFHLQMDEGPYSIGAESRDYSRELRYYAHVDDGEDQSDVAEAALSGTPGIIDGLIRKRVSVPRRITFDTIFEVIVEYGHPERKRDQRPLAVDEVKVSVRSSYGSTMQMDFSLEAQRFQAGEKAVKLEGVHERAIGVDEDGYIQGVPVSVGGADVVVETIKPASRVTARYLLNCALSTNKVNRFPYKGFPKGTLRLTGFDSTEQGSPGDRVQADYVPDFNLTFSFSFQPNQIANVLMKDDAGEEKNVRIPYKGHELLDIFKVNKEIELEVNGKQLSYSWPEAKWATVHRIFEYEDFETLLGI